MQVLNDEPQITYDQATLAVDATAESSMKAPLMKRRAKKSVNPEWQKRQLESNNFMPSIDGPDGMYVFQP